jgi:hypothetical protein
MLTNFANLLGIIITLAIFFRSPDDIQFRRQMSPLTGVIGNAAPKVLKNRFDLLILALVLILIFFQVIIQVTI